MRGDARRVCSLLPDSPRAKEAGEHVNLHFEKHPIWIPAIKTQPSCEDDTRSRRTGLSVNRMCVLRLEK